MKKFIFITVLLIFQLLLITPASALVTGDPGVLFSSFKNAGLEPSLVNNMLSAAGSGTLYEIEPGNSKASFRVRGPIGVVQAQFTRFQGGIVLPMRHQKKAVILISLNVNSLESNSIFADGLLKGDSFLDAQAHPTITFTGDNLIWIGPAKAVLKGKLTMHGISREVAFYVEFSHPDSQHNSTDKMLIKANTTINRSQFGMSNFSSVDDKVNLRMQVEAVRYYVDPL